MMTDNAIAKAAFVGAFLMISGAGYQWGIGAAAFSAGLWLTMGAISECTASNLKTLTKLMRDR